MACNQPDVRREDEYGLAANYLRDTENRPCFCTQGPQHGGNVKTTRHHGFAHMQQVSSHADASSVMSSHGISVTPILDRVEEQDV